MANANYSLAIICASLFFCTTACRGQAISTPTLPDVIERPLSERGEATTHCGLYSLLGASVALEKPVDLKSLFCGDYLRSSRGATATDLVRAAQDHGLQAAIITNLDSVSLNEAGCPVLLQLQFGSESPVRHWVACVGVDKGGIWVFDAPNEPAYWTFSELDISWNGKGVLVWSEPANAPSRWLLIISANVRKFGWLFVPAAFCLAILLVHRLIPRVALPPGLRRWGIQFLSILAFVSAWSAILFVTTPDRLAYGENMQQLQCWASEDGEIAYTRELEHNTIIDCRVSADFALGHIPGAISLPINSGYYQWRKLISNLNTNEEILVYCQSAQCEWARTTCQKLRCFGISAKVYAGGYERYVTENETWGGEANTVGVDGDQSSSTSPKCMVH